MTDMFDRATRSRIMAQVRSTDTSPELAIRKGLHAAGYRFRLHRKDLPGSPDVVLSRYRTAVFVNGCFWHGHDCKRGDRMPASNVDYWETKIERNRLRDKSSTSALRKLGWRVHVIWECELERGLTGLLRKLRRALPLDDHVFAGHPVR